MRKAAPQVAGDASDTVLRRANRAYAVVLPLREEPTHPQPVTVVRNHNAGATAVPYRAADGFSWQTTDDAMRTRRIVAALVLVAAGWATGFFAGRMSAWVFPVIETDTAALTTTLDKTPQRFAPNPLPSAEPPPAPRVEEKQAIVAKQSDPPAAPAPPEQPQPSLNVLNSNTSQQPNPQAGGDKRIVVTPDEGDRVEAPQNNARVAETNTERGPDRRTNQPDDERRANAMDDGRAFDAASVAECESRYASFRRSDGTYQPFGRSSRQVCPLLR